MKQEIVIVDYGMANLRSVQKAFEAVGANAVISSDISKIAGADRLVLPGVGAFRDAIARVRELGLHEIIPRFIESGKPFLGICLGLQMLFTRSLEDGDYAGLNLLKGDVVRFPNRPGLKVPHMGWNGLDFPKQNCPLFEGVPAQSHVYFVHGYYAVPEEKQFISATADYGGPFCAALWKDNLVATQFHPEKSQAVGLRMLKNFAEKF